MKKLKWTKCIQVGFIFNDLFKQIQTVLDDVEKLNGQMEFIEIWFGEQQMIKAYCKNKEG